MMQCPPNGVADKSILRLMRAKLGSLTVEGIMPGEFRPLTKIELDKFKRSLRA